MRAHTDAERAAFRQRIHDYERTDLWAARSRRFRASRKLQQCLACKRPGIEDVHHASYDRAFTGREPDADLRGLCHRCHMAIHDLTVSRGGSMSLWDATNFVLDHTPRWDVAPPVRRVVPWRYVPAPPVQRVRLPARKAKRRGLWWRRNLIPLGILAVLVVVGVTQLWAQLQG